MSVRRKSADVAAVAPVVPRQRRGSDLSDKVAMFNKKFHEHHEKQLSNPFSDVERPEGYQIAKLDVNDPNYGRYYDKLLFNWFLISKTNQKSKFYFIFFFFSKSFRVSPILGTKWIIYISHLH